MFEYCTNLFGVVKLILLKISVGAIVVQGLIESFLYSSGTSPYKDDDQYDAEEKTLRAYCKIVSFVVHTHEIRKSFFFFNLFAAYNHPFLL